MAKNEEMHEISIDVLVALLSRQNVSRNEVIDRGELRIDTPEKLRIHLGNLIFYAYDFRKGDKVKKTYQRAVENTRQFTGKHFEKFVLEGCICKKKADPETAIIGWYLTRL